MTSRTLGFYKDFYEDANEVQQNEKMREDATVKDQSHLGRFIGVFAQDAQGVSRILRDVILA